MKQFDVNIRTVYGMSHSAVEKLWLPTYAKANVPTYEKSSNKIKNATKHVAEESMKSEADKLKDGEVVADNGVSVAGKWQKKWGGDCFIG